MLGRVLDYPSLKRAADALGVPRTHVRRLMHRAVREVGASLDWRKPGSNRLSPPAEIYRLVSPERIRALELASGFPRVSAGTMMGTWFQCQLVASDLNGIEQIPPRLQMVRSSSVIAALCSYEIDLALVHDAPGDRWDARVKNQFATAAGREGAALVCRQLEKWTAVGVGPSGAPTGVARNWRAVWWAPGDTAGRITEAARQSRQIEAFLGDSPVDLTKNLHCRGASSWLSIFEEARRGLPVRFVMPDIFVPEFDRPRLRIVEPESAAVACCGSVLALYRQSDSDRLQSIWKAFAAPPFDTSN